MFHSSMGDRPLFKSLYNGNSGGHHGTTQVLNNVKSVDNDFR